MDRERRTELAAAMREMPRWLRAWVLTILAAWNVIWKFVFVVLVLQAIGGVVGIVVGAVTLKATPVLTGIGQIALAGLVIAIHEASSANETISEVSGPCGRVIIRAQRRGAWRTLRGFAAIAALLRGTRTWLVVARHRADDPFGTAVYKGTAATRGEANALVTRLEAQVREGSDLGPG